LDTIDYHFRVRSTSGPVGATSGEAGTYQNGAVATAFNILHRLCGSDWNPVAALFAHRKPEDIEPFHRFFQAPLRFDAERSGLFFHAEWLKQPVIGADPELHRLLQKQIDELEARYHDDFPEQVRRVLRSALRLHHTNADHVAAIFSMHSRTLNRRLKGFGTSFQELTDHCRFEIARQMLEDSDIEPVHIAAALNYADASAFSRAFRRWSGITPTLWRSKINEEKVKALLDED